METIFKTSIFNLVSEQEEGRTIFRILSPEWVNILAFNERQELLLIRQWRHGIKEVTLEIPGGLVDEKDASPLQAAQRELREETGFSAERWEKLGWVHANPAYQNNRCHFFVARDARKTGEVHLDPDEKITETLFLPLPEVYQKVRGGEISNSMVVAAVGHYILKHGTSPPACSADP
jgi:ADP-ribose pyrophosphatase